MSNYTEKARDFLASTKSTLTIDFIGVEPNPNWKEDKPRNHYRCVLKHNRKQYTFHFWDSFYNTWNCIEPTEYDVLACLEKFEPDDNFEGFCREFGYDSDSISALKIHKEVLKQYRALRRLYNDEEMEALSEIC